MTTPVLGVTATALVVPSLTATWQGPKLAMRTYASSAGVPGRATAVEVPPNAVPTAASTAIDGLVAGVAAAISKLLCWTPRVRSSAVQPVRFLCRLACGGRVPTRH